MVSNRGMSARDIGGTADGGALRPSAVCRPPSVSSSGGEEDAADEADSGGEEGEEERGGDGLAGGQAGAAEEEDVGALTDAEAVQRYRHQLDGHDDGNEEDARRQGHRR